MKADKKILIISSWAPPMIGGPQNLYNIFSQFPKENLRILTSYLLTHKKSVSGLTGSWLPFKYYYFDWSKSEFIDNDKNRTNWFNNNYIVKSLYHPLENIYKMIRKAIDIINNDKIDVIVGISDEGPALISTFLCHVIKRKPYILYLFDIYKGNNIKGIFKILSVMFEKILIKNASLNILTNEATEEFYRKKYGDGIKTGIIYNSVFVDDYQIKPSPIKNQPPYKIIYAGNIYWAQEQSLINLIKSIDLMVGLEVQLLIYTPLLTDKIKKLVDNKKNIFIGALSPSQIPEALRQAHLLFLPLSWNTISPEIIATATPGKFTDYLASGRPILIHAPDYAYISQFAKKHKLGLVVDKNDVQFLSETISKYFLNPEAGQVFVENSLKKFRQNYDAKKNAEKLKILINIL